MDKDFFFNRSEFSVPVSLLITSLINNNNIKKSLNKD